FAGGLAGLEQLGEVEDAPSLYRGLTILVQPSRQESFSLVLLEAMASGCCVVAAALPHYPGLIEALLAAPSRAEAMGKAAVADVRARWTLDREVDALRTVYTRVEGLR